LAIPRKASKESSQPANLPSRRKPRLTCGLCPRPRQLCTLAEWEGDLAENQNPFWPQRRLPEPILDSLGKPFSINVLPSRCRKSHAFFSAQCCASNRRLSGPWQRITP
jgi:hypothetical protein